MTVDDVPGCDATAQHPELDLIGCELPAGHKGPHRFTVDADDTEAGAVEWDTSDDLPGAVFDVEAIVKALPEGVVLCPTCLGMVGVVEEPPFDPHAHQCATCSGRGKVRTGSLVSAEAERDCVDCHGKGWVANDPGELPASPARASDFAGELPPRDHMGRTPDDPEFAWDRVVRDVEAVPAPEPAA